MLVRSDSKITLRPAIPNIASNGSSQARHPPTLRSLAASAVPGGGMAVKTVEPSVRSPGRVDHGVDEGFVASHAVHANDVAVMRRDLDRLLEVLQGEGGGVAEAVVGLRHPLRDAGVGKVALGARRGVRLAALEPGVVLVVHDVAVHARARVGGEVREAVRVDERERADAGRDSQQAGEEDDQAPPRHAAYFFSAGVDVAGPTPQTWMIVSSVLAPS